MAGYSYTRREYSAPEEKRRPGADQIQSWETSETYSSDAGWNKTGFGGDGERSKDHVCRPVIVDAEGRKRPLIAYTPNQNTECYVTETETIVERVYAKPTVTGYKYSSTPQVETTKDYRVVNQGWGNTPVETTKDYRVMNQGWNNTPSQDRPTKVDGFITKVQTEASRPSRTGPMMNVNWRQSVSPTDYNGTSGYSGYSDSGSGSGGWNQARPSLGGWGTTPPSYDGSLTRPTSDISTAVNFLKEAVQPVQSPSVTGAGKQYQYSVAPPPAVPKVDNYTPTIDSREASRRYSGYPGSAQPGYTSEPVIDSREAARRYRGQVL